jgi:PAS domain S-box-containing protein
MEKTNDTEELLRSSALRTANSILLARQRAEQELVQAKEALELKTKELAHSLSMMRATLESTSDGILVTDGTGRVTGFNEKYVEMWRMPREVMDSGEARQLREVAARQFKDPQQFLARIKEIEASSLPESFDVLEFADGKVFERYSKIQRGDEQITGRVWSFRDITERRQAKKTSERLAAIVDSSDDAIVGKDLNGIVTSWNAGAERIFGYSASEMTGASIRQLIPPERQSEEDRIFECIRRGERVNHMDTVRVAKGGRRLNVSITVSPIKDSAGNVIGASKIARDITDRKRAEERLRAAKNAAEEASKAKDDFLAVLSHELRTPLTPALVAASYLAEHADLAPQFREEVTTIWRNVQLEARLIDDLLDITRITRGKIELRREAVDAHRLLRNALQIVHNDMIEKQLELVTDLRANNHHVWADPVRIQQVFWNLMTNAVKFTPKAGRITTRSWNEEGRFGFEITDTGIGIEAEQQDRIFKAFEQGERSITRQFGGLGLGLTISKTLVDLHGGTLSVQSQGKNLGAKFRVMLDVVAAPVATSTTSSNGDVGTERSLNILVVDDDADTRRILSRLLSKCGYEVAAVDCVQGALKLLEKDHFDTLISDISLPDSSGYELVREVKQRQWVTSIALSGFGTEEDVRRTVEAGFDHHLTKPVNFQDLRSLLRKIAS